MTIIRPRPEDRISRNNQTFTETWLRAFHGVIDAVSGAAPPKVPTVYINPTGSQRGLPSSDEDGQLVLVMDEAGGPGWDDRHQPRKLGGAVLAFSVGGQWRRVTDRAVIS